MAERSEQEKTKHVNRYEVFIKDVIKFYHENKLSFGKRIDTKSHKHVEYMLYWKESGHEAFRIRFNPRKMLYFDPKNYSKESKVWINGYIFSTDNISLILFGQLAKILYAEFERKRNDILEMLLNNNRMYILQSIRGKL